MTYVSIPLLLTVRGVPVSYPHAPCVPTDRRSTAVVEGVRGMSQETLNTILAGVAALTGVAGILLSARYNRKQTREREEDRQLAEEQLELARGQAEMRPNLRVVEVRVIDQDESDVMEGAVDPSWITKLRALKESPPLSMISTFLSHRRLHDEPYSERVVLITLANDGKQAAYVVTGWIYLKVGTFVPLKPSGAPNVSLEGDEHRVAVVGEEGVTLPPRRSLSFRVIVAVLVSGTTQIRYDFAFSEGRGPEGSEEVSVQAGKEMKPGYRRSDSAER